MTRIKNKKAISVLLAVIMVVSLIQVGLYYPGASAATGDAWDLNNFVKDVIITNSNGPINYDEEDSNYNPLINGENCKIVVVFYETPGANGQFDYKDASPGEGYLIYTLPKEIQLQGNISNGKIRLDKNSLEVGSYSATAATGEFLVKFGDFDQDGVASPGKNFIDYTDARFKLEIDAKFVAATGPGQIELDFGGKYTFTVDRPQPAPTGLTLSKSASSISGGEITYTVTITATGDDKTIPITGIGLKDAPYTRTTETGTKRSITAAMQDAYSGFSYKIDRATGSLGGASITNTSFSPVWKDDVIGGRRGFTHDFSSVTLYPGDVITATYKLNVNTLLEKNAIASASSLTNYYYSGNDVSMISSLGSKDYTNVVQTNISGDTTRISKDYSAANSTAATTWKAWVGNGTMALNGETIKDTLTSASFPAPSGITVNFYTSPRSLTTPSYSFNASELSTKGLSFSGNVMTFVVPDATISTPNQSGGQPAAFGTIYRVEFVYNTAALTPTQITDLNATWPATASSVTHTNKIEIGTGTINASKSRTWTGQQTGVPGNTTDKGIEIYKMALTPNVNSSGNFEIDYTVEIHVPDSTERLAFYFQDSLYVNDIGHSISNTPTNLAVQFVGNSVPYTIDQGSDGHWYIYFGGGSITSASNSIWPANHGNTTVEIMYTIELTPSQYNFLNLHGLSNELHNRAVIKSSGAGDIYAETVDMSPIHKAVAADQDHPSVFNYTVTLNGGTRKYVLFKAGEAALITDIYDKGLSYVPGSFYVTAGTETYRPAADLTPVTDSDDTSKMTFTVDLRLLEKVGGGAAGTWYTAAQTIEIRYQLCVPDVRVQSSETFDNTVRIDSPAFSTDFTDELSVDFVNDPVKKAWTTPGNGNVAKITIDINPNGWKLAPNGTRSFKAIDTMSSNMSFYMSTITVMAKEDGSWVEKHIEVSDSGEIWSVHSTGTHSIEFTFPDEVPITITYDALITTPVGGQTNLTNDIELVFVGYSYSDSVAKNLYEVQDTAAGASARKVELSVTKSDSNDDSVHLEGAEFELYMAIESGGYYGSGTPTNKIDIGGVEFYLLQTGITEDNGVAVFDTNWLTPSHGALYMLLETAAPRGYILPSAPDNRTFFVLETKNDFWSDFIDEEDDPVSDNILITNVKQPPPPPDGGDPPPTPPPTTPPPTPPTRPPGGGDDGGGGGDDGGDNTPPPDDTPYTPGGKNIDEPPVPMGQGHELEWDGEGWLEFDDDGVPLGRWEWDDELEEWIFDMFPPLGDFPPDLPQTTGYWGALGMQISVTIAALSLLSLVLVNIEALRSKALVTVAWRRHGNNTRWITRRTRGR